MERPTWFDDGMQLLYSGDHGTGCTGKSVFLVEIEIEIADSCTLRRTCFKTG